MIPICKINSLNYIGHLEMTLTWGDRVGIGGVNVGLTWGDIYDNNFSQIVSYGSIIRVWTNPSLPIHRFL